jgi:hypothetical protein
MAEYGVNITWVDRMLQTASNSFVVNDRASALTLATNLANYIRAGIKAITITEKLAPSEIDADLRIPDPTEDYCNVDVKAVVSFMDDTGASHTWELPAPNDGIFEEVPKMGLRVTKEWGDMIATTLSNELGISLSFQEGWYKADK